MAPATLAIVAADSERVADVHPSEIPALIGEAEALRARLWARLQAAAPTPPPRQTKARPETLLTVQQAAERLAVTTRWLYRNAGKLPFTRRLSAGTLRFSEQGLERWMAARN